MAGWFRLYDEFLDDPKVQRLSPEDGLAYVNLLCLANRNDGKLPDMEDVAFALRRPLNGALTLVERLVIATLIDKRTGGPNGYHYAPHGWAKRQFKSDTSTERVKRFRQRSETVSGNAPEQSRTEQNNTLAKANGDSVNLDAQLWAGAKTYLGPSKSALIGKWKRDHGIQETMRAITAAQHERAVDPISFIEACFRKHERANEYVDPC